MIWNPLVLHKTLRQHCTMPESSLSELEQIADQLIANWPEAWLMPWNFVAISHVDKIRESLGSGMDLYPGEQPAISNLISLLGEESFRAKLGDLIAMARVRYNANYDERQRKLAEDAAELEQARIKETERNRVAKILEQKRKEELAEIERRELAARELARLNQVESLRKEAIGWFESDYLQADNRFQTMYGHLDLENEYRTIRRAFLRTWFNANIDSMSAHKVSLDDEQLDAIGQIHGNIKLVARAGSGKTATLVHRAYFMIRHCSINPAEIMLLAFNRLAVLEIRRRLLYLLAPNAEVMYMANLKARWAGQRAKKDADRIAIETAAIEETSSSIGVELPFVITFHALARAIVQPTGTILHDDERSGDRTLSLLVQGNVDRILKDDKKNQEVRALLMAHFKNDWETVVDKHYSLSKEEFLEWRRSLPKQSIDGRYFKSTGEKVIADFLFENSVEYLYERNFWWNSQNYKPDFTILKTSNSGVVIEYFGLLGDPAYNRQKEDKQSFWAQRNDWSLLSLYPHDLAKNGVEGFKELLQSQLRIQGIQMRPLTEEEIWKKIKENAILRYTIAITQFILRCRQLGWNLQELQMQAKKHIPLNEIESIFIRQAIDVYSLYADQLAEQGDTDFSQMLSDAAAKLMDGHTAFNRVARNGDFRSLKYLFVDEFQDFSFAFDSLLKGILFINPKIELFCVGDDWQAINGFAGSDLFYFEKFATDFPNSNVLSLATNHRSDENIVAFGNVIMNGHGIQATASNAKKIKISLAYLDKLKPTPHEQEIHSGDLITPALLRLLQEELEQNRDVVILSRTNTIPYFVHRTDDDFEVRKLDGYLSHLRSYFDEDLSKRITISTAHRYKGREKMSVILIDANVRRYPFIHPDWVFSRIFGSDLDSILDEERRLFYVAATRAIEHLIIVTEKKDVTPFLQLEPTRNLIQEVRWDSLIGPVSVTKQILVLVGNSYQIKGEGTFPLRELLKSSGYEYIAGEWSHWRKPYVAQNFSLDELRNELWAKVDKDIKKSGIEVRLIVSPNIEFARYQVQNNVWEVVINKYDLLESALEDSVANKGLNPH